MVFLVVILLWIPFIIGKLPDFPKSPFKNYPDFQHLIVWGTNLMENQNYDLAYYEPSLRELCDTRPEISIIHLFGVEAHYSKMAGLPGFSLRNHCNQTDNGLFPSSQGFSLLYCPQVGGDISYCQSKGKKVLLVISNTQTPIMKTDDDGIKLADMYWNLFLGGQSDIRPFGPGVILDGIDLWIRDGVAGYAAMSKRLSFLMRGLPNSPIPTPAADKRSKGAQDNHQGPDISFPPAPESPTLRAIKSRSTIPAEKNRTYLLVGTPRCSFPDANFGPVYPNTPFSNKPSIFDYIVISFMSSPDCSYFRSDLFYQTLHRWANWVASTKKPIDLVIQLPANTGVGSPGDYIPLETLMRDGFVNQIRQIKEVKGISLFDYSLERTNFPCAEDNNGLSYGQLLAALFHNKHSVVNASSLGCPSLIKKDSPPKGGDTVNSNGKPEGGGGTKGTRPKGTNRDATTAHPDGSGRNEDPSIYHALSGKGCRLHKALVIGPLFLLLLWLF